MELTRYPGTTTTKTELSGKQFIDGIFLAASGLVMSQLNELTGLKTPALQNWVNRGFLSRPENKKYNKEQTARILIINFLKQGMSLDDISKLLFFVNGKTDDLGDDIISESELYGYICDVIFDSKFSYRTVEPLIEEKLLPYNERFSGAKERLKKALSVICYCYLGETLLSRSHEILKGLDESNIFGDKRG